MERKNVSSTKPTDVKHRLSNALKLLQLLVQDTPGETKAQSSVQLKSNISGGIKILIQAFLIPSLALKARHCLQDLGPSLGIPGRDRAIPRKQVLEEKGLGFKQRSKYGEL
jgi:hypothetical protein